MTKAALTTAALLTLFAPAAAVHAQTVAEKKLRASVDDTAAKAADDIKDCGKKFKVSFDWKAFDAIDWKKIGRDKNEYYSSERNNLNGLGDGVNRLCGDKDYKAALGKISTIVYRSTNDDSIRVKAEISGSTLTFSNYSFGSTRDAGDYDAAAKAAL